MNYPGFEFATTNSEWLVVLPWIAVAVVFGTVFIYETGKIVLDAKNLLSWLDDFKK